MKFEKLILWLICSIMGSGCVYLKDRVYDGSDVLTLAVEDQTLGAAIYITYPLGFSISEGHGYGFRDGYVGRYQHKDMFAPYHPDYEMEFLPLNDTRNKGYYYTKEDGVINSYPVGASFGLYYGIRVTLNLSEILDFVLGFSTLDIMHDDKNSRIRKVEDKEAILRKIEEIEASQNIEAIGITPVE